MNKAMELLGYGLQESPNQWNCSRPGHTYYFANTKTIFTGIPKSGCSNWIEFLLRTEGILLEKIEPTEVYKIHEISDPYRLTQLEVLNSVNLAAAGGNVFSFAVVRNPWTRLVSGYRDKLSDEPTQGRSFDILAHSIVRKMNKIDGIINDAEHPTFDQYLRWIVLQDKLQNDHFTPQHLTLCIPHAKYDYLIPLEYSSILSRDIAKKINGSGSDTLLGPYGNSSASDPRLQSSTLLAKEWLSKQDAKLIDQLYSIYEADFVMMNYSNFTHPDFPLPIEDV